MTEIERYHELEVEAAIRSRWPDASDGEVLDCMFQVVHAAITPFGGFNAMVRAKEEAWLDDLARHLNNAARVLDAMHPEVRMWLLDSLPLAQPTPVEPVRWENVEDPDSWPKTFRRGPALVLYDLRELVELHLPSAIRTAKEAAASGVPPGGRREAHWRAAAVAQRCREVWHHLSGHEAPRSLSPGSAFSDFVHDVFEVLELQASPRAAMQALATLSKSDRLALYGPW